MPTITDWLTSIGTVGAVIVAVVLALWGGQIRQFGSRARFKVLFERKPPDCQLVTNLEPINHFTSIATPAALVRFRVDKNGITAASNVEVRMLQLWRAGADGILKLDPDFLPVNLVWTNSQSTTTRVIHPGLPRHCDFLSVLQSGDPTDLTFFFNTDVERQDVREGINPYINGKGRYRVEIGISADDMPPLRKTFEISFSGSWSDDPDQMFNNDLVVKLF